MEKYPKELRFTESHEWVREETNGVMVVGISEYAQALLGELVFVELPELVDDVHASDETCVVESVKAASDVYSPVSGKIIEVNTLLEDSPGLINSDPYGDGWLFKIKPKDRSELDALLTAELYEQQVENEES
jgi:glycine cleavage system H protein